MTVTSHRPSPETSVDVHSVPPNVTAVLGAKAEAIARSAMRVAPTRVREKGLAEASEAGTDVGSTRLLQVAC